MSTQAKYHAFVALTEEFFALDHKAYKLRDNANRSQANRAEYSAILIRRMDVRHKLRDLILDHNAEVADRKIGIFPAKSQVVQKAAESKGYAFRNLKTALEMDPADTRGLPKLKGDK